MKFVVIGALGHIGSYLVRRLPQSFAGCEIVMIDNLATQRFPSLFNLPATARYRFVELDVTTSDFETLLAGADAVVHLAAITDASASFEKKDEVERVNLTATTRVAQACANRGVPMVMASSTSVYGTQADHVDEFCGEDQLQPQSPYAETKLKEEAEVWRQVSAGGLRAAIFRFGTIYGISPGMRFHTAVNKFCWQAVMEIPLTVWTTAYDQKRPYLDIDDCARAIAFVIENNLFDGNIYNVVSANATVRDVVGHIRRHIPDLEVRFVDHAIMNQMSYEVLNTRMNRAGFQVRRDLAGSIANTIALLKASNAGVVRQQS